MPSDTQGRSQVAHDADQSAYYSITSHNFGTGQDLPAIRVPYKRAHELYEMSKIDGKVDFDREYQKILDLVNDAKGMRGATFPNDQYLRISYDSGCIYLGIVENFHFYSRGRDHRVFESKIEHALSLVDGDTKAKLLAPNAKSEALPIEVEGDWRPAEETVYNIGSHEFGPKDGDHPVRATYAGAPASAKSGCYKIHFNQGNALFVMTHERLRQIIGMDDVGLLQEIQHIRGKVKNYLTDRDLMIVNYGTNVNAEGVVSFYERTSGNSAIFFMDKSGVVINSKFQIIVAPQSHQNDPSTPSKIRAILGEIEDEYQKSMQPYVRDIGAGPATQHQGVDAPKTISEVEDGHAIGLSGMHANPPSQHKVKVDHKTVDKVEDGHRLFASQRYDGGQQHTIAGIAPETFDRWMSKVKAPGGKSAERNPDESQTPAGPAGLIFGEDGTAKTESRHHRIRLFGGVIHTPFTNSSESKVVIDDAIASRIVSANQQEVIGQIREVLRNNPAISKFKFDKSEGADTAKNKIKAALDEISKEESSTISDVKFGENKNNIKFRNSARIVPQPTIAEPAGEQVGGKEHNQR